MDADRHVYSKKFKNKSIPRAKVGRRVFKSLFNAETFCSVHDLNVDEVAEYDDSEELKVNIQEIAKTQKAILNGVLEAFEQRREELKRETELCTSTLATCHPLEKGYWEGRMAEAYAKLQESYTSREIVWKIKEELEVLTGWHD